MKTPVQLFHLSFPYVSSRSGGGAWLFNVLIFAFIHLLIGIKAAASTSDHIVLLISYDGFRYDYLDKYKESLPTLRKIAEEGSRPEYVQNVFPTETFPNHYTIVTGLYPESHGIIANNIYDPVYNASFTMMTNESRWWESGEPIWVTNEKQNHKSGSCFWPGYNVKIRGHEPSFRPNNSYGKPFAETKNLMPWKDRVDLVASWFNKSDPPSFVNLYFEEPDEVGHAHGTDSLEMEEVLKKLDNITIYLMEQLKKLELFDRINFIFTSDHGMINYNANTIVNIDKYVDPESYTFWTPGGSRFLITNSSNSTLDDLYHNFKKAEKGTKSLIKVYRKEEMPNDFHYRYNRRIADIVGVVKPGYLMNTSKFGNWSIPTNATRGTHGYGLSASSMHPYLIGYGPAFKQGYKSGYIEVVDLYPLMCHILGIKPAANNGSLNRIKHILRPSNGWIMAHSKILIVLGVGSGILFLICITCLVFFQLRNRNVGRKVFFNNHRSDWDQPLMDSDDEEDEIVIM